MAKLRDKGNITNELVDIVADILENQKLYNELVLQQLEGRGAASPTTERLLNINKRISEAVELMRELAGCWS